MIFVGLFNNPSDVSEEYGFHLTRLRDGDPSHTGLPVLVYPHFRLTRLLEGDPCSSLMSLDTVVVGEVDELEEDVG